MRKIKSLALIALTSFAIAACSSGNKEVEQASVDDLYAKGAAALQEGSYSDSIRYLKQQQSVSLVVLTKSKQCLI